MTQIIVQDCFMVLLANMKFILLKCTRHPSAFVVMMCQPNSCHFLC